MPRFLNTTSGEFEWHNDPSQVSYAIISHTWRPEDAGGEQSYHDIRKLQAAVEQLRREAQVLTTSSSHPAPVILDTLQTVFTHPDLSGKIKGICKIAREAGYELLWLDSCCIDKTSSAELSEAINSMFEWYRLADVCYVYLEDVHEGDNLTDDRSEFWQSRWHKRGWTLQELIAPERVVFLSISWSYLGTRMGLASTLAQITGIDFDILTGRATVRSASVARRMAWAAKRETTRVEDRAYCLMGIFNIHMSPIYGEGVNAFLRLQEEIIRTVPDQSIFTWGRSCTLTSVNLSTSFSWRGQCVAPGLLASCPSHFEEAFDIIPLSPAAFARRLGRREADVPPLHCIFTPQGVRARLLCIDLIALPQLFSTSMSPRFCKKCMSRLGHAHALALLPCKDADGSLIALPLCRATPALGSQEPGVSLIATHTECTEAPFHTVRLATEALLSLRQYLLPAPMEISLLRHHWNPPAPKSRQKDPTARFGPQLWPGDRENGAVIRVAPRSVEDLRTLGFVASPLRCERREWFILAETSITSIPQLLHSGAEPQHEICLQLTLETNTKPRFLLSHFINSLDIPGTSPRAKIQRSTYRLGAGAGTHHSGDAGHDYVTYFLPGLSPPRVLADAHFLIHVDSDPNTGALGLRLVRVGLERPVRGAGAADDNTLWVFIEMSQGFSYRHTRSASVVDGQPSYGLLPFQGIATRNLRVISNPPVEGALPQAFIPVEKIDKIAHHSSSSQMTSPLQRKSTDRQATQDELAHVPNTSTKRRRRGSVDADLSHRRAKLPRLTSQRAMSSLGLSPLLRHPPALAAASNAPDTFAEDAIPPGSDHASVGDRARRYYHNVSRSSRQVPAASSDVDVTPSAVSEDYVATSQMRKNAYIRAANTPTSALSTPNSMTYTLPSESADISCQIASLMSQNAALVSQNTTLMSRNTVLSAQVTAIFAHLEGTAASTDPPHSLQTSMQT